MDLTGHITADGITKMDRNIKTLYKIVLHDKCPIKIEDDCILFHGLTYSVFSDYWFTLLEW